MKNIVLWCYVTRPNMPVGLALSGGFGFNPKEESV